MNTEKCNRIQNISCFFLYQKPSDNIDTILVYKKTLNQINTKFMPQYNLQFSNTEKPNVKHKRYVMQTLRKQDKNLYNNLFLQKRDYTLSNHYHHTGRAGPSDNLHQCLPMNRGKKNIVRYYNNIITQRGGLCVTNLYGAVE